MRGSGALETSDSDPEVTDITVRLRHCRVTVRVGGPRQATAAASSSEGFSVVEEPVRAGVPLEGRWAHLERHKGILTCTTPAELAAWDIGVHSELARGLGNAGSSRTARVRIGRAFRAGLGAALVVEGAETQRPRSLALTTRNRFFVCLWAPGHPDGFWRTQASVFFRAVAGPDGQRIHPEAVWHGFPSRSEVTAFLAGADKEWPAELRRER